MGKNTELLAALIGGVLAVLEGLQLFVLSDLRDRLVRLEDHYLRMAWTGAERRASERAKLLKSGETVE